MSPRERVRMRILACVVLLGFAVLFARLVQIQVLDHGRFVKAARQQQTERMILEPERGRIYDRHLRSLAENVYRGRLTAHTTEITNTGRARRWIRNAVGRPGVLRFDRNRRRDRVYIRVTSTLPPEQQLALETSARPEGLHIERVPARRYPLEGIARPVVGACSGEGVGLDGLEREFERELSGSSGWATLFKDGRGGAYQLPRSLVKLPEPGVSLVTTLDLDAQQIAALKLRAALARTGAKSAMAVFVDPKSGDVLAMVTVDAPGSARQGGHRNRIVADQYEPGSTLKFLAGTAGLEEHRVAPDDSFYVQNGQADLGGFTVHDAHPDTGWLTFREATVVSSNVCYSQIGMRLGTETLYRYARLFGLGQPTRITLPGEAEGRIRHPRTWSTRSLATISFGQEILVTPLQLVMAYAAIANGGTLMRPRIVAAALDEEGTPLREFPAERVRRVISEETARTFRTFLRDAVRRGSGIEADLDWCDVAGKTGTAQKSAPGGRGYEAGRYMASFVGMAPASDPAVVGLVVLDEPRGAYYGGAVAAPVFREILSAWAALGRSPVAMRCGQLRREESRAVPVLPDVRLLEADRARAELEAAGLRVRCVGAEGRVVAQDPEPGTEVPRGGRVTLTLASGDADREVLMPDLRGLSVREALDVLRPLEVIPVALWGNGAVAVQDPVPGARVRRGSSCSLHLSPRDL